MRRDDLGLLVPFGGGGGEKELIKLASGNDPWAVIANIILKGRFVPKQAARLARLATIGRDHEGTKIFIVNQVAASLSEYGFARNEYLMAHARMLVPSAMPRFMPIPPVGGDGKNGKEKAETSPHQSRVIQDNE